MNGSSLFPRKAHWCHSWSVGIWSNRSKAGAWASVVLYPMIGVFCCATKNLRKVTGSCHQFWTESADVQTRMNLGDAWLHHCLLLFVESERGGVNFLCLGLPQAIISWQRSGQGWLRNVITLILTLHGIVAWLQTSNLYGCGETELTALLLRAKLWLWTQMRCSSRASEEAMVLPGSMQDQERNMQNPEACNFAPPGVAGDGLVASIVRRMRSTCGQALPLGSPNWRRISRSRWYRRFRGPKFGVCMHVPWMSWGSMSRVVAGHSKIASLLKQIGGEGGAGPWVSSLIHCCFTCLWSQGPSLYNMTTMGCEQCGELCETPWDCTCAALLKQYACGLKGSCGSSAEVFGWKQCAVCTCASANASPLAMTWWDLLALNDKLI